MYDNYGNHGELKALSGSYVPEWHFTEISPDPGSVLAMLIDDMRGESIKRYGEIFHKHKIQYLNLFDRLKEEPVESAKSYVRFDPVGGFDEPVFVPKGTRLTARPAGGDQEMVYETTHAITTTSAELKALYSVEKETDTILRVFGEADGAVPEEAVFTAFGLDGENCAGHRLCFLFSNAFDLLDHFEIGLRLTPADEQNAEAFRELMAGGDVAFSFLEPDDADPDHPRKRPFDGVRYEKGIVYLRMESFQPQKISLGGMECYAVVADSKVLSGVQICGAALQFGQEGFAPEEVLSSGIAQNIEQFHPFGSPPELFAACEFECPRVLARKGADVSMKFRLGFDLLERRVPEIEEKTDYKIVMKKEREIPKAKIPEVWPDYVLIEYLSDGNAWKRLLRDENSTLIFNGGQQGDLELHFICPDDIKNYEAGQCRLRFRLMKAEGLYNIPSNLHVPVISGVHFAYSYLEHPLLPDTVYTENNFVHADITANLRRGIPSPLFYNNETAGRAMYFGFDGSIEGSPLSLYFEMENNQDVPLDYAVEYLSPEGFVPAQTVDHTCGMLYSGAMLILVPSDAAKKRFFDFDGWWLRIVSREKNPDPESLPTIRGIFRNLAKVENVHTLEEIYFVDNTSGEVILNLSQKNLISAKVYVNEENNDPVNDENWVLWEKRTHFTQQGRCYNLDPANGTVTFEKGCFASYPLMQRYAAVKVRFQSYQGSAANVPEDTITSPASALTNIASVTNPIPAYGGYDGYNEETSAKAISNILRTRNRAVSERDYFDLISQVSSGVSQIKCVSGVDRMGEPAEDVITVALLINEFEKGSRIFSAIKDTVHEKLTAASNMVPLGKTLVLCQPHFIPCSVRVWLNAGDMDNVYELQRRTEEDIGRFLDPLKGGFDGKGWKIGVLPTTRQLLAFLKMERPGISVEHIAMSAKVGSREYSVDDDVYRQITNPFVMAIGGKHIIYVNIPG
ncbi:MAG TPA: hypothetical protein PLU75_05815 [Oscillospiraceae bacterium]|nr:hypothetical protein [Oscillospiraceae bacterium]HRW57202.1 hypothetical protein [Oscillospiraceae bacterium]